MKSERPLEVGSFNQMIQCYVNELLILIFVWAAEDFNTTSQIMSKRVQIDYMLKNDKALITRKEARKKACYRHNLHLWRSPKRIIWKQPPLGKKKRKEKKNVRSKIEVNGKWKATLAAYNIWETKATVGPWFRDMHANFNSNINKMIVKKLNSIRRSRKMTAS